MSSKCPLSAVLISLGIVFSLLCLLVYFTLPSETKPPELGHGWWGEGEQKQDDPQVYKIGITIPDSTLEDLKQRLSKTRFFEPLEGIQWQYGTNAIYMKDLVNYWQKDFDWRKQESLLNSLPTYNTQIEGLKIHFWHVKPDPREGQKLVSILLLHGWPGSIFEFYKVIKILNSESQSEDGDYAYEVVCPSIPGYGFSDPPRKPGFDVIDAARIFSKLMTRLGIDGYYVQGGDYGSFIAHSLAVIDKSRIHVKGLHINLVIPTPPHGPLSYLWGYFTFPPQEHKKIFPLMDFILNQLQETGYFHLQATRPDTVGFALSDSPAGLAAYIIEKFSVGSGCRTNESYTCLESRFTRDELLTNIMLYWIPNTITPSMRLYKETIAESQEAREVNSVKVNVPTALSDFPHEINFCPKSWLGSTYRNLIQHKQHTSGGHFAAFEKPEMLTQDIREFIEKVEKMETSKSEL